ncbi:dicarboxylate/amino acid:cation symporter [bacterium]|nr:dicarboxylate/amino acid:cation symporter [bacterium]
MTDNKDKELNRTDSPPVSEESKAAEAQPAQEADSHAKLPPAPKKEKNPWDKTSKLLLAAVGVLALVASVCGLTDQTAACNIFRWIICVVLVVLGFKRKDLTTWIVIAMILGIEIGYSFHSVALRLHILSKIFLKLVKSLVAPLLFGTLVVGIAGHSNLKELGRMGLKAIIYFEIVTTFALVLGLVSINLTRAGDGIQQPTHIQSAISAAKPQTLGQIILHAFPENIAKSVAEGEVLQVVVFCLIFGVVVAQLPDERRKPFLAVIENLSETMFKYTNIVMYFAPLGVGGAIAATVADMGLDILKNLLALVATFYVTIFVFILCILVPVMFICRINPLKFFKFAVEPVTLAFATASSESALPLAMQKMERFGVPKYITAFVMPVGYSFNLDGTTLYLSLASIFVAQAAGVELTMTQQISMLITLLITSKGVAGVPRASLVILLGSTAAFGLPEWPIMAILGVDQIMDMCRTATNVLGNCLASAVVARWEGVLGEPKTDAEEVMHLV